MHILLVEDDKTTADYTAGGLRESGNVVDVIENGKEALIQCLQSEYDVLIVDRMLPGMDGLSLVKSIRNSGIKTPILFLTALAGVGDRVDGLESGGDDYLSKPFAFSELLARVNALARRPAPTEQQSELSVGDLRLDLMKRIATRGDVNIELLPREFLLLEVLMRNCGRVVSKTMLLEQVWSFDFDPKTSVVETHISRLRGKIDKPFGVQLLHTVRSLGYSMRSPQASAA